MSQTKSQIVVAFDFSPSADVALARALELACRAPEHVLHFLTVLADRTDYQRADSVRADLLGRLKALFAERAPTVEVEFFVHVRIGAPVEEILSLSEEVGADQIIIGSHSRTGARRLLLGSVSEAVVRGALCPVLVARPKGYQPVALDKVIELPPHAQHWTAPHRYSYTSSMIQTRPAEWPLR